MKFVGLIMAFLIIILLGFMTIGFTSTQTAPNNTTAAGQQYENLSKTVEIGFMGMNGVILLLIIAIVLAVLFLILKVIV